MDLGDQKIHALLVGLVGLVGLDAVRVVRRGFGVVAGIGEGVGRIGAVVAETVAVVEADAVRGEELMSVGVVGLD